jgi:sugar lactone lactonase YvrE
MEHSAPKHSEQPGTQATQLLHTQCNLGEGAIWNHRQQVLHFVDINDGVVYTYDPVSGLYEHVPAWSRVGTVVPVAGGGLLLATQSGITTLDPETGVFEWLANPLRDPAVRYNDGKCDPSGRFWIGTMAMDGRGEAGALYKVDGDGSVTLMLDRVSISNGLVWSADRSKFYYIDTPTGCVQVFDYDDTSGTISNGRTAFAIPAGHGSPDGMCIDSGDRLWIAMWGGASVNCYDPATGALLHQVFVPAPHTSSCAFGGPDLDTLYITTARVGLNAEQLEQWPQSGNVFVAKPGATGVEASYFRRLTAIAGNDAV